MNTFVQQLEWRYAVKKFDASKKINSSTWSELENALRLTASSYGLQPWKFLIVQNQEKRKQLRAVAFNQSQVEDCSHFVVFTALKKVSEDFIQKYVNHAAKVRNVPPAVFADYQKMMVGDLVQGPRSQKIGEWAARQCYIALGNLLAAAAMANVDACPMEGIIPAQFDEILGLTSSPFQTVMACALGYRSSEDPFSKMAKVRYPKEEVIQVI